MHMHPSHTNDVGNKYNTTTHKVGVILEDLLIRPYQTMYGQASGLVIMVDEVHYIWMDEVPGGPFTWINCNTSMDR